MTNIDNDIIDEMIFKPCPWRWFFYHWALTLAAAFVGFGIVPLLCGFKNIAHSFPGLLLGVTIVMALFSRYPDNWKIVITEDEIRGGWKGGKRIIIPIDDIDRARSFRKTALGKLLGFDYIYSRGGQKIYVESISLGREQVSQIKSILKV